MLMVVFEIVYFDAKSAHVHREHCAREVECLTNLDNDYRINRGIIVLTSYRSVRPLRPNILTYRRLQYK